MIRVVLIDDETSVRRGVRLRLALEPDIEVVGESGDASQAPCLVARVAADLVVLDVELPGEGGIQAAARLREAHPGVPVIVLTLHDDERTRADALAAGAVAFISKASDDGVLVQSIRQAAAEAASAASPESAGEQQ